MPSRRRDAVHDCATTVVLNGETADLHLPGPSHSRLGPDMWVPVVSDQGDVDAQRLA